MTQLFDFHKFLKICNKNQYRWIDINVPVKCIRFRHKIYLNIGHKYKFQGMGWSLSGSGSGEGGPDPKKISFNRLLIHISNVDG